MCVTCTSAVWREVCVSPVLVLYGERCVTCTSAVWREVCVSPVLVLYGERCVCHLY